LARCGGDQPPAVATEAVEESEGDLLGAAPVGGPGDVGDGAVPSATPAAGRAAGAAPARGNGQHDGSRRSCNREDLSDLHLEFLPVSTTNRSRRRRRRVGSRSGSGRNWRTNPGTPGPQRPPVEGVERDADGEGDRLDDGLDRRGDAESDDELDEL